MSAECAHADCGADHSAIKVLDHGFVRMVKHMASDQDVVDAARVCYRSQSAEPERDKKLIGYLMAHDHLTPFEHAVVKFHVKAPIFVARQWFRHRTSSYNEVSARYTEMRDEFYMPTTWRAQDNKNKQGSAGPLGGEEDEVSRVVLRNHCEDSMQRYRVLLAQGAAKELARLVLPVNLYTEWYWTINARNLMAFIRLRSEKHAQWETRQYANALWRLWAPLMPWTAEAFLGTLDLQRYHAEGGGTPGPNLEDLRHGA
jgi:thymidylate synthase (FAD)